jgi:hypothetical protein
MSRQTNYGVVQVMYNYKWGDACDEGWNDFSATIVCKELGFVYGIAECCSALGPSDFRYNTLHRLFISFFSLLQTLAYFFRMMFLIR